MALFRMLFASFLVVESLVSVAEMNEGLECVIFEQEVIRRKPPAQHSTFAVMCISCASRRSRSYLGGKKDQHDR